MIEEQDQFAMDCSAVGVAVPEPDSPAIEIAEDPLLVREDMPLVENYFPLGFKVELTTNSPDVLAAAEESWGSFPAKPVLESCLRLRVGVVENSSLECPPAPVCRAHKNLLSIIADAENFTICDLRQGFAFSWVSKGAVQHRAFLRYHVLESAALSLLAASHVAPIHAACVERAGRGVLLCGNSGAGKSSLAFACSRRGWTYVTDDASYLVNGEDRVVVGNPSRIRFRPSAVPLFPELEGLSVTTRAAGKPSIEVATRTMPYLQTAGSCRISQIVFLNRQSQVPPALVEYPSDLAQRWFSQTIFNSGGLPDVQFATLRKLLAIPIHELRYSDLDWAVSRLDCLALDGE